MWFKYSQIYNYLQYINTYINIYALLFKVLKSFTFLLMHLEINMNLKFQMLVFIGKNDNPCNILLRLYFQVFQVKQCKRE